MTSDPIKLRVLLTKEAGDARQAWVARCVDHDIAGQGDSIDDALESLEVSLVAHLLMDAKAGRQPFQGVPAVPGYVQASFERAKSLLENPEFKIPHRSQLPHALIEGIPEPWQLPVSTAQVRVC